MSELARVMRPLVGSEAIAKAPACFRKRRRLAERASVVFTENSLILFIAAGLLADFNLEVRGGGKCVFA